MTGRLSRACRWGGLAAILLFAFRVAGEERLVLPGVVRASGVGGSRFVSTVWLHNPSESQLAIDLALVASTGPAGTAPLVLDPRQTLRVDDPVASRFGLDSAAGALTARADRPFLFRGVTANVADPLGTYSLALMALRHAEALKPGESGVVPWLTPTLAAAAGSRPNVAVTLLEPGTEALVTIVDDAGLVRGEKRLAAANALFWQQPVAELASDAEIPLGRVEVRVLRGAALAYAAVVDDGTGDGVLALARRVETPAVPPDAVLLPGAARISGANGFLWRTGLRIVTPGKDAIEVMLEVPGGSARAPRFVPPRGTFEESDLLAALGYEEGNAAPVRVLAFTGLSAGSGTSGFRTNVAFVGGPAGASGRLLLRASSGERLAEAGLEAGPSSWTQKPLSDWLGAVAVPRDASLEVTVDSGSLDA